MSSEPLTPQIADRICKHMNNDHPEAVSAYAIHYGGIRNAYKAKMVKIKSDSMDIEVDGEIIQIAFDHNLRNSEDAHKTLVAMLKCIDKDSAMD